MKKYSDIDDAIQALTQGDGNWNLIENAPKKAKDILLYFADDNSIRIGFWAREIKAKDAKWCETHSGDRLDFICGLPTYWMHLPKPPMK